MKYIISGFIILSVVFNSCSKNANKCNLADSTITAPSSETTNIESYLMAAGITGTQKTSSGVYYKITQTGTGTAIADLCSAVSVKYEGRLTNGVIFDQTTGTDVRTFTIGQVIVGWQKGLPQISSGGKITLYIPPSLGYGNTQAGIIPPNSILIFDIELVAVANYF